MSARKIWSRGSFQLQLGDCACKGNPSTLMSLSAFSARDVLQHSARRKPDAIEIFCVNRNLVDNGGLSGRMSKRWLKENMPCCSGCNTYLSLITAFSRRSLGGQQCNLLALLSSATLGHIEGGKGVVTAECWHSNGFVPGELWMLPRAAWTGVILPHGPASHMLSFKGPWDSTFFQQRKPK
jgi:hypothetical protein